MSRLPDSQGILYACRTGKSTDWKLKRREGLNAGLGRTVCLEFIHWTALQSMFDLELGSTDLGFDRGPFLLGECEKDL